MNDISYETLWQVSQREKQTNELQLLPKTFYNDIEKLIRSYEGRELSEEEEGIKKNVIKMFGDIAERRKQKVLIYVAYKKQIPQPSIESEQELYNKLTETYEETKFAVRKSPKGASSLVALQAIPEIILPSGKKLGPLTKDQTIEINADEEDIKFLINNTICKQV